MDDDSDYSMSKLENCSYRYLQQLAKSMKLPSNVKKVYLVEMINAKKCSPESEVQRIVQRVKLERQHLTQVKKRSRRTIIPPDTSSDESSSPPITITPKRPPFLVRCSELRHQIMRPHNSLLRTSAVKPVASDRVLRSYSVKTVKRPYVHTYLESSKRNQAENERPVNKYLQVNPRNQSDNERPLNKYLVVRQRNQVDSDRPLNNYLEVNQRNQMDNERRYVNKYLVVSQRNRVDNERSYLDANPRNQIVNERPKYLEVSQTNEFNTEKPINKYLVVNQSNQVDNGRPLNKCLEVNPRNQVDNERPFNYVEASLRNQVDNERNQVQLVDRSTQMSVMKAVKKYKPNILASRDRQSVPATQIGSRQSAALLGVGVRARDGTMHALHAVRRAPHSTGLRRNIELTLQDIINGNVDAQANSLNYPNTSGVTDTSEYTEITSESTSSVYYHKKIRAEQVRERRMSSVNPRWFDPSPVYPERCELPRIGDAFNQFRGHHERDVTQPIYVQVSEECERILQYPQYSKNTCLLETVYNFKNHFLAGQTLLQPAADTKCVYSTPTVPTAAPHRPAATSAEAYTPSYERDNQYYHTDSSRMSDWRFAGPEYDFRCHEDQNTSGSSVGTAQSQELGANVTISDMVEDALELISQDGDYMERMGMDVRMQCVLCSWAGPKIILEYHIRKEHASEIDVLEKRECNISYTLESILCRPLWRSRVLALGAALYVLSVKHEPPGRLLATLASLSPDPEMTTGSITIFNKVSGEPFSWCGDIQELPASLPYDTNPGLQVNLASLDLLPNSANLKFFNGELVMQSPSKVVFGPLELNDIHIILFVKISD